MGIFGLNFTSICKPIIEVGSSKVLIRIRTSWFFLSNFQEMEGIGFVTMVFLIIAMMGGHEVLLKPIGVFYTYARAILLLLVLHLILV